MTELSIPCFFCNQQSTKSQFVTVFGHKALVYYCDRDESKYFSRGFRISEESEEVVV